MRTIFKIIFFFLKALGLLILMLVLVFVINYISCPIFSFQPGKPFEGELIYNPYQDLNPNHWHKGNFQVQSRAWGGITSGSGNSNEDIYKVYKNLGYEIIATSDYQRINRFQLDEPGYIPVYEHGYSIPKTHQVLIGANRVLWKDYPFFQTIHNKQNIINKLRPDNQLIFLAHPKLRDGYTIHDMRLLANYDGIEVLNNYRTSNEHWDAALSAGNYVTLIGNDDAHDISNPDEIGHHCTLINSPGLSQQNIIKELKSGRSIGVKIWRPLGETMEAKIKRTSTLPVLKKAQLEDHEFLIETDSVIREVRFIGQNGELLKTSVLPFSAVYTFTDKDSYVRAEIEFENQITFYLNPVCRYDGNSPAKMKAPEIDLYRTWLLRVIGFATLGFLLVNYLKLRKRRKMA